MADCRICGERSSFFRRTHKACLESERRREAAAAQRRREDEQAREAERREAVLADARELVARAAAGTLDLRTDGRLPFNLQKTEKLFHAEGGVDYRKFVRQRAHRTTGASIRVARGVWIRQNAGSSRPDDKLQHVDTGVLGLTTRHLYFAGSRQRFRVRLDKLVTHQAYADALSVTRDNATAMPEMFGVREPERVAALLTAAYEQD